MKFGRNGHMYQPLLAPNTGAESGAVESGTDNAENHSEGGTDNAVNESENNVEKTFTQKDVNNLVARESKSAQEKLLKDLGIEDFENAKDGLKKFQEWQESQKTEAEKQAEALEKASAQLSEKEALISRLEAEKQALIQGVNADSIDDVILLAQAKVSEETTIEKAIETVITQYPHFKSVAEENDGGKKPKFVNPKNPSSTSEKALSGFDLLLEKTKPRK